MALKLISVNIERSKHLERVLPFIEREQPDVLCVQELMERDLPAFQKRVGSGVYAPTALHPAENDPGVFGLGIFSRFPMQSDVRYYWGDGSTNVPFDFSSAESKHATESHALVLSTIAADTSYRIATTHFTWTPDGSTDDYQRRDLRSLLVAAEGEAFVLCGDFNAPRVHAGAPGQIFAALAARYRDNIPPQYTTSIDKDLHRAGDLQLMVDGLFTTPEYIAKDVHLVNGVSDHMAIVATIEKVTAMS